MRPWVWRRRNYKSEAESQGRSNSQNPDLGPQVCDQDCLGLEWPDLQGSEAAQMPSHPLASGLQELTRAANPHVPEHHWE